LVETASGRFEVVEKRRWRWLVPLLDLMMTRHYQRPSEKVDAIIPLPRNEDVEALPFGGTHKHQGKSLSDLRSASPSGFG
jgi:hypothetical protein